MIFKDKNLAVSQLGFFILSSVCILLGCQSVVQTAAPVTDYSHCPDTLTNIPLTKKYWKVEYVGHGTVAFRQNQISIRLKAVDTPQTTHASLVLSRIEISSDSFELSVDYKNEKSVRKENPNPWEVFWLLFNYVPGASNVKTANYAVAKTNGFEVGRMAKLTEQAFVRTSEHPQTAFDQWQRLHVIKSGEDLKVYLNSVFVFSVPSAELFTAFGKIGLYAEDAWVTVKRVCLKSN